MTRYALLRMQSKSVLQSLTVNPRPAGKPGRKKERMTAREAADLTRRINAGKTSYWEAVNAGLTLHRIKFRWDDEATGAINSASGPGPVETAQIWASNEAPLQEVFNLLWPEGPSTPVFNGHECIYHSWYSLLGSDWGRDGGLETPISASQPPFG